MKNLYIINKWLVILTLALYITINYGMLFQIVLGSIQVLMGIYILSNYNSLNKKTKSLFNLYMLLTIVILSLIFYGNVDDGGIWWLLIYLVIPMLLAFLHLYITYKIKQS